MFLCTIKYMSMSFYDYSKSISLFIKGLALTYICMYTIDQIIEVRVCLMVYIFLFVHGANENNPYVNSLSELLYLYLLTVFCSIQSLGHVL